MNNKKSIIDTYTTIYYVDIVVANKYSTLEELKELYTYSDGTELDEDILESCCATARCTRKVDNKNVLLVKYNRESKIEGIDKQLELVNTICHEAGHCILDIYDHMGQNICSCSSEPFCYLLGYIAECIFKTLRK